MQPDPLSPQPEESQPVSLPVEEGIPVEVTPVQEIVKVEPVALEQRKAPKRSTTATGLGVLVFLLLVAVAAVGYWAFTLNNQLTMTRQQLAALQGEHDKLKKDYAALVSDKDKLNTDLTQTKADLEKANVDLAAAKGDLQKSKNENAALSGKIDKTKKLADILYKWFNSPGTAADIFDLDTQIKATDDAQLKTIWKDLTAAPTQEKFGGFILYLVKAVRNSLQ